VPLAGQKLNKIDHKIEQNKIEGIRLKDEA
jgi:hypothetical protein